MPPKNGVCGIFSTWTDLQVHVFSNFWGEGCLFTILMKEETSRCSFDVGFHSTVSRSALKFGEDVTVLQSNTWEKKHNNKHF